tara:strand:- start:414 stop:629 length:216 start_codon:yes stop_codon:yes gene_type:complete
VLKGFWKKDMVKDNINLNPFLEPSTIVLNSNAPDCSSGQVQSKICSKVTINFENVGKLLIDGSLLDLEMVN